MLSGSQCDKFLQQEVGFLSAASFQLIYKDVRFYLLTRISQLFSVWSSACLCFSPPQISPCHCVHMSQLLDLYNATTTAGLNFKGQIIINQKLLQLHTGMILSWDSLNNVTCRSALTSRCCSSCLKTSLLLLLMIRLSVMGADRQERSAKYELNLITKGRRRRAARREEEGDKKSWKHQERRRQGEIWGVADVVEGKQNLLTWQHLREKSHQQQLKWGYMMVSLWLDKSYFFKSSPVILSLWNLSDVQLR